VIGEYTFVGMIVPDRESAIDWYSRFMGRPPDLLPNDREATWQLTPTSSLYILADPTGSGRSVATIVVADLDSQMGGLRQRGINAGEPEVVAGAGRKSVLPEPFGNSLAIVELVGGNTA
jgi:hypothetical protein